jgi:hypothetical protein
MLGKLWRGLRGTAKPAIAVKGFIVADDLPPIADTALAEDCRRALAKVDAGDGAAALEILEHATMRHAGSALAWALAGALAERLGDPRAAGFLDRARDLDVTQADDAQVGQHFYAAGREAINRKDHTAAERCLLLAQRMVPGGPAPLEMLGIVGYLKGDTAGGRACYDLAMACAAAGETLDERHVTPANLRLHAAFLHEPVAVGASAKLGGVDQGEPAIRQRQVAGVAIDVWLQPGDAVQLQTELPKGQMEELELQQTGFGGMRRRSHQQAAETNLPHPPFRMERDPPGRRARFTVPVGQAQPDGLGGVAGEINLTAMEFHHTAGSLEGRE